MRLSELECRWLAYRTRYMEGSDDPFDGSLVTVLIVERGDLPMVLVYREKKRLPELKPLLKIAGKSTVVAGAFKWASPELENPYQRKFATEKVGQALSRWTEPDWRDLLRRGEGYYSESGKCHFTERIYAG